MPEVSIVIPVYNRCAFLRQAVVSCLLQSHSDLEVIVVDDGSTEPIQGLLDRIEAGPRGQGRIRYIRQPRLGANAARNRGLRAASGELIQFLDSDDLLHPAKLSVQRELLREAPSLDLVFGLDEFFRDVPGDYRLLWNAPDDRAHLDRFLVSDPVWHTGSPLWRRETLDRIGPWNETLVCWQDWEYHIRALARAVQLRHVPTVLQYVREHSEVRSTSLTSLESRERSKHLAARAVAAELHANSLWSDDRGDALAGFVLSTAARLSEAPDARQECREVLRDARSWASTGSLKWVAGAMQIASLLPSGLRIRGRPPVRLVHRLAEKLHVKPRPPYSWQTLSAAGHGVPQNLVDATANGPVSV